MDREMLIEVVLRECKKMFEKLGRKESPQGDRFGHFPQTAYVCYCGSTLRKPEEALDPSKRLRAWRLSGGECVQLADPTENPPKGENSGMYFHVGSFAFCISEDCKTAKIDMWLGPRYGCGLTYEIIDEWGRVYLSSPTNRWVS